MSAFAPVAEVAVKFPWGHSAAVLRGFGAAAVNEPTKELAVEGIGEYVVGDEGVKRVIEVAGQWVEADAVGGRVVAAQSVFFGGGR
jgi:hypothetical protein